jgi:DNA-binding response OmpR family regulator
MIAPLTILVVEDEPHIAQGIIFNLEQEGFEVRHVETGEAALQALDAQRIDLVVLDLMLPDMSGLEVCREVRRGWPELPILMLTALSREQDRIAGLAEGADDYLTKPFSLDEFLLRVRAILRRTGRQTEPSTRVRFGANEVDLATGEAQTRHGEITLTELEVRMLRTFLEYKGMVLSRAALLQEVWGVSPDTETRTLDNFIVRMRRYFEPDPTQPVHFLTVRGRGYRFVAEPEKKEGAD